MEELHRLDGVAYVRFASVYRQFKDIQEFMDELKDLLGDKEEAKKEVTSKNLNFKCQKLKCQINTEFENARFFEI